MSSNLLFFKSRSQNAMVKIDLKIKKIIRLTTEFSKLKDRVITKHSTIIETESEDWQIDEVKSTFLPASEIEFNTRKDLIAQQTLQQ